MRTRGAVDPDLSAVPSTPAFQTTLNFPGRQPRPPQGSPPPQEARVLQPGPFSAHLHAEVRQPRLEFRLQGQDERADSRRGAAARVRQDHLGRHLGQVAAQVHRALHILVDQRRSLRRGAAGRRGQGPEPQQQHQADRRLHVPEQSAGDQRPAPSHGATADWTTAPQDGWAPPERTPSPGQPGNHGAPD